MGLKIAADDYGMSFHINKAISELAEKKVISKVSVMVTRSAEFLNNELDKNTEIGLHINLTKNANLVGLSHDELSPFDLVRNIYSKKIKIDQVVENIDYQFGVLNSLNFKVSYLDTHQHIHIIPAVLRSLIAFSKKRGIKYIRCITLEKKYVLFYFLSLLRCGFIKQIPKMIVLYLMGVFMKKSLDKARIDYCKNLILMPLAVGGYYQELLEIFIGKFKDSKNKAEIVSHPGFNDESHYDEYMSGREIEYQSLINQLASGDFKI